MTKRMLLLFILFEIAINSATSNGEQNQAEKLEFVNEIVGGNRVGLRLQCEAANKGKNTYCDKTDVANKESFHIGKIFLAKLAKFSE